MERGRLVRLRRMGPVAVRGSGRLGDGHGCERGFCAVGTDADLGGRQRPPTGRPARTGSPRKFRHAATTWFFRLSPFLVTTNDLVDLSVRLHHDPRRLHHQRPGAGDHGRPGPPGGEPGGHGDRCAEPHAQQGSDTRRHQRRDARAVGPYHCQELREARCRHARAFRRERRHHRSDRRGRLRRDSGNQPAGAGRVTGRAH